MSDLPDLCSANLMLQDAGSVEVNLHQLAQRQAELSRMQINWYGTYQHAVQVWLRPIERNASKLF
jgi:hypothetical protein